MRMSILGRAQALAIEVSSQMGTYEDADEERSSWVADFARAVRVVTQSLFPPFRVALGPLGAIPQTHTRLMAGYLLHHDDGGLISVLYCELHPQSGDRARLSIYENESCQVPVVDLYIGVRTTCCEKVGVSCSCFFVEDHLFSARSLAERKLWLRAISNVKVKLQHCAPLPSPEELSAYRYSIKEHLASSREGRDALQRQPPVDALLGRREFGEAPRQALRLQPAEQPEARPPPVYAGYAGRSPPGYAGRLTK